MPSWLRLALTCLIAAALPLQGVAAATLLHCGQNEPAAADSQARAHAHSAAMSAGPAAHHGHHHATAAAEDSRDTGTPATAAKAKCSVCASCCIATALPTAIHAFDPSVPVGSFEPIEGVAAPAFLTGGPERPPRRTLA